MNLEEVGTGAIHLVDEHHPGNGIAIGLAPDGFRLGLNTAHCAEHGDHTVENAHGTLHLDGEVDVPGGVDDVDPMILPAGGDGSGGDGDATLALLSHPVGDCGTVVHLTDLVNHTGIEQNPFCRGGFARINVGSDTNISDAFQGKGASHRKLRGGA